MRERTNAPEGGFTLVEMLITVWIMGAVTVALMGSLFTMTTASDYERRNAVVETELRHYVDAINAAPYVPCATTAAYAPATVGYTNGANAGVTASVNSVLVWQQAAANDTAVNNTVSWNATPAP